MIDTIINTFTPIIYLIGIIIEYIGLTFIVGFVILSLIKLPMKKYTVEDVRQSLAQKIIFGLELVIAADVLLVTVATNVDDLLQLGGIVIIRILLGYALRKEVGGGGILSLKRKK